MSVEHADPRCVGTWSLVGGEIVCERCGRRYTATAEVRKAAVDENCAGEFLRRATREGTELLLDDDPAGESDLP